MMRVENCFTILPTIERREIVTLAPTEKASDSWMLFLIKGRTVYSYDRRFGPNNFLLPGIL
jgi:hypothetical protein